MSSENTKSPEALQRRIDAEMLDSFDEEPEMELDDERLSRLIEPIGE
jgi:polyphosphate kinase